MEKKYLFEKMFGKMVNLVGLGFLTLVLINYFFLAKPAFGQTSPASGGVNFTVNEVPQVEVKPCDITAQGPLTDSPMKNISLSFTGNGTPPAQSVTIDFSQLQALFAKDISDYTEGSYQDQFHQQTDIASQNSTAINYFFGPSQKLIPRANMDKLRQDYISHVYYQPTTTEANVSYTDSQGKSGQTIVQMVQNYGLPRPPTLKNPDPFWDSSWGRYWSKIPTATSDQTKGKIKFFYFGTTEPGATCVENRTEFEIAVPEFTRLAGVSQNLNQLLVPKIVQSKTNPIAQVQSSNSPNNGQVASVKTGSSSQNSGVVGLVEGAISKCAQAALWTKENVLGLKSSVTTKTTAQTKQEKVLAASTGDTTACGVGNSTPGQGVPFCPAKDGQGVACSGSGCNPDSSQKVFCSGKQCTFTIQPSATANCGSGCEYKIQPVLSLPYLKEIWNQTTFANEQAQIDNTGTAGNQTGTPGYLGWFAPSLPSNSGSQPIASQEENRRAGKSPDISTSILGASTEGKVAAAAAINTNFYPRFIGGTNNFRSFVQFSALSPIPGGAYRPGTLVTGPTPTPGPTPPSPTCDSIVQDGSPGSIQAYVICEAQGKKEPKTGLPLDEVMLGTMGNESGGGNQCAAGTAAEIGVFQYTAETWLGAGLGSNNADSGSGDQDKYAADHSRQDCWKTSGPDPYPQPPYDPNDARFRWDLQFPCPPRNTCDANAWDPYLQVDATVHMMMGDPSGVCRWTGFKVWITSKYGSDSNPC